MVPLPLPFWVSWPQEIPAQSTKETKIMEPQPQAKVQVKESTKEVPQQEQELVPLQQVAPVHQANVDCSVSCEHRE